MAYVIAAPCLGHKNQLCVQVCPAQAIAGGPSDPQMYINPALCIECGLCLPVCPSGAIFPEEDLPEAWLEYIGLNRDYFRNSQAASPGWTG